MTDNSLIPNATPVAASDLESTTGATSDHSSAASPALDIGHTIDNSDTKGRPSALLGPPLLLAGESKLDYDAFLADVSAAVKPRNILEQVWVRDFVDHEWSVLRSRRHGAALINASKTKALQTVLASLMCFDIADPEHAKELAKGFTMGDKAAINEVNDIFETAGLTFDAVLAEGAASRIEVTERLDRMAANAQKWRDAAVREIDRRRLGIGMIERFTVAEIEDEGYRIIQLCHRPQEAARP